MRLAETPPAACSGCYLAQPELRHVDFDVAWDGPMFPDGVMGGDGETRTGVAVSIDDLILCETCLRAAAAHVGLVDPDRRDAQLSQVQEAAQNMAERMRGMEDYIAQLEATVAAKPAKPAPPAPAKRAARSAA